MKVLLPILKIFFILLFLGYLLISINLLLPLSISSLLLFVFALFLAYPSFVISKSLVKDNVKQTKKALKISLTTTLLFSIGGPLLVLLVLNLPFYSQAFEGFAIPIIFGVGLITSFFLELILYFYNLSTARVVIEQNLTTPRAKSNTSPATLILLIFITLLLLAFAYFLATFRIEG